MLAPLPDRKPMFDKNGFPTLATRVWWQSVTRDFEAQRKEIEALEARIAALEP